MKSKKNKKATIFHSKKNQDASQGATENWIISDLGSEHSAGQDSSSSFHSLQRPRFQASSLLQHQVKKQGSELWLKLEQIDDILSLQN